MEVKGLVFKLPGNKIISIMKDRMQEHGSKIIELSKQIDTLEISLTGKKRNDEDISLQIEEFQSQKNFHQERIMFLKFWSENLDSNHDFILSNHDLLDYELIAVQIS